MTLPFLMMAAGPLEKGVGKVGRFNVELVSSYICIYR